MPPPEHEHMNTILCFLTNPRWRTCSGVWLIYPMTLHCRKLIFPFPADTSYTKLPGQGCKFVSTSSSFPWSSFGECSVFCHGFCELTCGSTLLCLEDTVPWSHPLLLALTSLPPLLHRPLNLEEEWLDECTPFRAGRSGVSYSLCIVHL